MLEIMILFLIYYLGYNYLLIIFNEKQLFLYNIKLFFLRIIFFFFFIFKKYIIYIKLKKKNKKTKIK